MPNIKNCDVFNVTRPNEKIEYDAILDIPGENSKAIVCAAPSEIPTFWEYHVSMLSKEKQKSVQLRIYRTERKLTEIWTINDKRKL